MDNGLLEKTATVKTSLQLKEGSRKMEQCKNNKCI